MSSFNPLTFDRMSQNYESLLKSGKLSDVALVVGDNERRVHKLILSARSPVFAEMFAHKGAQENRVEIVDVNMKTLELLVRYIYTGQLWLLDLYAADLLVAADKYQLDCLKSICEQKLLSKAITTESVFDLLILADTHQATVLYSKCADYVSRNVIQVMASEGWTKIRGKPDLLDKLEQMINLNDVDEKPKKFFAFQKIKPSKLYSFDPLIFEEMSEHYESLLESGNLSDVVLAVGEKEFCVHKVILSARSPVFSAMFFHASTKEEQANRVEISNVDVKVVELLVRYIYTGKVEMLEEYAKKLFIAADQYQVDSLKSICEHQLVSQVCVQSVSDLLILADMHTKVLTSDLSAHCLEFIVQNSTEVMASDGWNRIVIRAHLMTVLYECLNSYYSDMFKSDKEMIEWKKSEEEKIFRFEFNNDALKQSEVFNDKEEMPDVVLVAGGQELKVHKKALSARSPVFAAMFAHSSTKEAQENRVDIIDVDVVVLKLLIKYIYTDKVDHLEQYAADLLVAADKYQLDCLKSLCVKQLLSEVNYKSVLNLFILADMHQATELCTYCLELITFRGTRVMREEDWKIVVLRADLMVMLFKSLSEKYNRACEQSAEFRRSSEVNNRRNRF